MKQAILRYDFSESDQNHVVKSFPFSGTNRINNYQSDHNRHSGMLSDEKKANSKFVPVGFFIQGILMQILNKTI